MSTDGRDVRMCCNLSVLSSLMNVTMSATITIIIITPPPVILPLITGHRSDVTVLSSHISSFLRDLSKIIQSKAASEFLVPHSLEADDSV